MRRLLLIALLLLCSIPVVAADKWTRVQSKNFTLVGNATANEIREVAEGLEVFRTAFSRFFKLKEGSSVATTVIVFKSDQAFKPFKPVYQGKPANVAGYFMPGADMNFIALAADMQTPRVIYHEYVHRLMSDNMGSLPPWFQEGFAECFSTIEIEGKDKKVRLGRAIAEHVELLNERRFMPLEKLFAVTHDSPEYNEEDKQGVFYAESWALVHYMMFNSEQRRTQFNNFLNDIGRGRPAAQAFQDAFDTELAAFQQVFEAYIQQRMAWNAFEMQTPTGLDRSKDMTTRTLSEAEAEYYPGDLLLHLDRTPEAETHLAKAIQLDPKLGAAHASMGRLLMSKSSDTEALPYLQRATELDPGNYLTHYYYASLIYKRKSLSDTEWATMRGELQKSLELAPQFVEAAEMLASANLARNVDIPQTVELLAKALSIAPGRDYLAVQLAVALSRTQQRQTARILVRNLLTKQTLEPPLRQTAQSLLEFLDRAAAAEEAGRERTAPLARDSSGEKSVVLADVRPPELRDPARRPPNVSDSEPVRDADPIPPGTSRIRGVLTQLDCRDGLTLVLAVDGKTVKLHSRTPNDIKFTSFNAAVSGSITCGPTPGNGVPAAIVYRPRESGDDIGDPLAVDFIETLESNESRTASLPRIPGTSSVKGTLTMLDCSRGVSISIVSEGKTLQFHSETTANVAFMNGPNPDGTVNCGSALPAGLIVTILYKPAKDGDILGEPVIVQFQRN
jgi:tetratricopeptide (TPR) repeat protein